MQILQYLFTRSVIAVVVIIAIPPAYAKPLKIYISADMEGISAVVNNSESSSGGRNYERFRRIMTADVNAAIEAAIEAGAEEIVVSDSHGGGDNLLVEDLHPLAKVVRSQPRSLDMMHGLDSSFDAALLIGYHASAMTKNAIQAHTMSGDIQAIRLNNTLVPEGGVSAAVAGAFGVPVVLVSGDRAAIEEMRSLIGDVEGAEVKVANGVLSATTLHPSVAQQLIRDHTRAALARLKDFRPYQLEPPIRVDIEFKNIGKAEVLALMPGLERTASNVVSVELQDMSTVASFINAVMYVEGPDD